MFTNILVPTDGSKLSQKAVQEAILLAKTTGAKLITLHVYPRFSGGPYGTVGPAEDILAEAHVRQHEIDAGKDGTTAGGCVRPRGSRRARRRCRAAAPAP
jgi:nucleotide-binding universal stress UspA family protein